MTDGFVVNAGRFLCKHKKITVVDKENSKQQAAITKGTTSRDKIDALDKNWFCCLTLSHAKMEQNEDSGQLRSSRAHNMLVHNEPLLLSQLRFESIFIFEKIFICICFEIQTSYFILNST